MRLKSKLLVSFASVVGLTLILGFFSWRAMDNMAIYSVLSTKIEDGLTDALVAQGSSLRYLLYGDIDQAKAVDQSLVRAIKNFEDSRAFIRRPERLAEANNIVSNLKEYQKNFASVVEASNTMMEYQNELGALSNQVEANMDKMLDYAKIQLRLNANDSAFAFSGAITSAQKAFLNTRLLSWAFARDPSPQNGTAIQNMLKKLVDVLSTVTMSMPTATARQDLDTLITSIRTYSSDNAKYQEATTKRTEHVKQIREDISIIFEHAQSLSIQISTNIENARDMANIQIMGISTVVVLLCLGIAFFLSGNVQAQLGKDPGELVIIARRVSNGDYDVDDGSKRVGVYNDMIAMVEALKKNIDDARRESERAHGESLKAQEAMRNAELASNEAAQKSEGILRAAERLEEVVNIVSSASTELSAQIEQSERGSMEQASRIAETATAMNEMNSTVLEVAKNANTASEVSASTRKKADSGAQVVQRAVRSIQQVQQQSLTLKDSMSKLDEDARAITEIMGVISDIADQTNLLALNAAIEAARAGEAGRGFAVVADEVRKLAEKTMDSTTHVGNAIKSIQTSASQSVSMVENAVKTIEEATSFATQSGEALQEIVTMVDGTADQVHAIATASEQQSASSDEINQSLSQVNAIAGETARAMGEAARAVSELAEQAHALTNLIEEMKRV